VDREAGGWRLEAGGWRLEAGKCLNQFCFVKLYFKI